MLEAQDSDYIWVVVVGFILAFILAFGIGANDVANSFGTSVGAKVLTLKQACIVATIFEVAGAVLIGTRVADTVRKGIIDINSFNGTEDLAMVGSLSALTGTSVWLLIATFFNLPVSGTHSVVGATMGFALVAHGLSGVKWHTFGKIAASWVVSPLMSGIVSSLIFLGVNNFILKKEESFEQGLKFLPLFYAFTITINLFSVFYKGSQVLGFHKIPLYGVFILTFGGGIITAVVIKIWVVPYMRRKIIHEVASSENAGTAAWTPSDETEEQYAVDLVTSNGNYENDKKPLEEKTEKIENSVCYGEALLPENAKEMSSGSPTEEKQLIVDSPNPPHHDHQMGDVRLSSYSIVVQLARSKVLDEPKIGKLFAFLQIMTACFGGFAHGGNDVSNCIGPLMSLWTIFYPGYIHQKVAIPVRIVISFLFASNCIGPLISLWTIFYTGYIHQKVAIPVWILFYGGAGISIGLWVWGRRVIKTVGEDLTPITPTSGFTIEIGSAITVLIASNLGIPISTTHCKVGSVVMVGRVRSKETVDWGIFRKVILAWIVTMPVAGALSAAAYAGLREVV